MREEEKKRTSQKSNFQRIIKKRWALPAIYIICAAIILSAALWYQNYSNDIANRDNKETDVLGKNKKQPAVEVNKSLENFSMPVKDQNAAVIKKQFYDAKASKEEQEAALVFYNNTYEPNKGIDIAMKDGKDFDVVASISGKVSKVEEDSVLGNVIEVQHEKGIVTRYTSVKDFKVAVGDKVSKGQAIAKAGQSLLNEEAGTHVHFEIRKDSVAVNPLTYFNKSLTDLEQANVAPEKSSSVTDDKKDDTQGSTEDTPSKNDSQGSTEDTPSKDEAKDKQSDDSGKTDVSDDGASNDQSTKDQTNQKQNN